MAFPVRGIFTSHWSSDPPAAPIDWSTLRQSGYVYAFIKATDWVNGKRWIDPAFERDWYEAQKASFLCSAMHYFRPEFSPHAQADHLLQMLFAFGKGQLPPSLDVEEDPPHDIDLFDASFEFLYAIDAEIEGRPILYTSPGHWNPHSQHILEPDRWLYWIANWSRWRSKPIIPKGFPGWHFWQHLEHVNKPTYPSAPGITGPACPDRFYGDFRDLMQLTLPIPSTPDTFPISLTASERDALISIGSRLR